MLNQEILNLDNDSFNIEGIESLESLEAASWGEFFGGVGIGLTGAGLVAAGIAIT